MAKLDPVDGLKQLKRQFQTFLDAVAVIEDIGNLELAQAEAEKRLGEKRKDEAELSSAAAALSLEIDAYQKKSTALQQQALDELAKAKTEAEQIKKDARKKGEDVLAKAAKEVQGMIAQAQKQVADVEAVFAARKEDLSILNDQVSERSTELAKLDKQVEKLKAQVSKILE